MDILKLVKNLNFPQSEFLIIGGAAMAIRKIKETKDIDILVSKDLLEQLKKDTTWNYHSRIVVTEESGLINNDKTIELYPTIANDTLTFSELKANQEIIGTVPVACLNDVLRIKEFYHREKDLKDIELIKLYLNAREGSN